MVPTKEDRRQLRHQWNRRLSTFCPRTICTTDGGERDPTRNIKNIKKHTQTENSFFFFLENAPKTTITPPKRTKFLSRRRRRVVSISSEISLSLFRKKGLRRSIYYLSWSGCSLGTSTWCIEAGRLFSHQFQVVFLPFLPPEFKFFLESCQDSLGSRLLALWCSGDDFFSICDRRC